MEKDIIEKDIKSALSYEKLRIILVKRKISWKKLMDDLGLTYYILNKLKIDDYVEIRTLEKICLYLNLDIGDIMQFLPNEE